MRADLRALVTATLAGSVACGVSVAVSGPAGDPGTSPLALSCTGCHQAAVNSPAMPSLAAWPAADIAAALRQSRDRPSFGSIMARFTARLSDADIDTLARQLGTASEQR